jgi:hypothetical protein
MKRKEKSYLEEIAGKVEGLGREVDEIREDIRRKVEKLRKRMKKGSRVNLALTIICTGIGVLLGSLVQQRYGDHINRFFDKATYFASQGLERLINLSNSNPLELGFVAAVGAFALSPLAYYVYRKRRT